MFSSHETDHYNRLSIEYLDRLLRNPRSIYLHGTDDKNKATLQALVVHFSRWGNDILNASEKGLPKTHLQAQLVT